MSAAVGARHLFWDSGSTREQRPRLPGNRKSALKINWPRFFQTYALMVKGQYSLNRGGGKDQFNSRILRRTETGDENAKEDPLADDNPDLRSDADSSFWLHQSPNLGE